MDKNSTKVFGTFTYAESMTYDELLDAENELKENLDHIFLKAGGEHLDFTPLGDMLMFQCAFEERDIPLFRDLAAKCAQILPTKIKAKFMFLEKNLTSCQLFWISRLQWQEAKLQFPDSPPEGTIVHHVPPRPAP